MLMKLKVKDTTVFVPIIKPGQDVSLRTNGAKTELWDFNTLSMILELTDPRFTFHMDEDKTEIEVEFYQRVHGAGTSLFTRERIALA